MERLEVVAFIPVRGGSKSIPLKNIKALAGKPLVYWTIEAALGCPFIQHVYVCTDSDDIANCVSKIESDRLSIIGRSPETATDTASSESVLVEFCRNYDFQHVFFIQATSPLLSYEDLSGAWLKYSQNSFHSLLSVVRQKRFLWEEDSSGSAVSLNYEPLCRPRRQDYDGFLVENGAFYLSSREDILSSGCRISGNIGTFEMKDETYYELDEPSDWLVIESLLINQLKNQQSTGLDDKLNRIKMLVMDVDGVLTDAGMYYSESGDELKKFNTRDGKGLELARKNGFKTAIITNENTKIVERRAAKLQINYVFQNSSNKEKVLRKLSSDSGIKLEEIAYIGDDLNDLPAIKIAGLSACPANAVREVKELVDIVLKTKGGEGAVRELCDLLLLRKT